MKPNDYSLTAILRAAMTETWGKISSLEHSVHRDLVEQHGHVRSALSTIRLPHHALATRDMTVALASGGGYLVDTKDAGFLPSLQPRSVALSLGAQTLDAGRGNIVLNKASAGPTAYWLADENAGITETQPTFGQVSATPKVLALLVQISHQMLKQSNAEELVRNELRRAAGAAIDAAVIAGSGSSGQPLGIVNTSGIGAFTGGTLNRSALTNAQLDVADANAFGDMRGYVTTPTVANVLANRADTIASTTPIWQGNLHDGIVCGERAISTKNVPASTMIYGNWSNVNMVSWGTLELAIDPFTYFNTGIVQVRLLAIVDVVIARAASFTIATSVS